MIFENIRTKYMFNPMNWFTYVFKRVLYNYYKGEEN